MRVLWFASSCGYVPEKTGTSVRRERGYNGAAWVPSLFNEVKKQKGIEMGVCFTMEGQPFKNEQDGVIYYPVPIHRKRWRDKVFDIVYYKQPERDYILWDHYKNRFKQVIDDFKPDVIEIFGSELYLGLATFVASCPVILHLQGLLSLYIYTWFPPKVSYYSYLLQDWNPKRIYRRFQLYVYWQRSCYREQEVLRYTKHVIGRTHWDELATKMINPDRIYHYGGEVLRPEFYVEYERKLPERLSIVTTTSAPMYKGFDYILQITNILKNVLHRDFEWQVFGNVDPTFAERFTHLRHDDLNIRLMGVASATELCQSICHATLYFQPSYIENSPNSLCEAQVLGVPVVATNVGGTASLIEEGETGFLIPTNDPYTASYRILQLYENVELNNSIGHRSRISALIRHDKDSIVDELFNIYRVLLQEESEDC